MKNLILIVTLVAYVSSAPAQDYVPYGYPAYTPPAMNYNTPRTPQYVQTIENNGPQVDMRRNMDSMNRQIEYGNAIRNYELIYGDTYRR